MRKNVILFVSLALPFAAIAYAGPIDRFHDMLYAMMDGIWPLTFVCGMLYAVHLLNRSSLKWLGLIAKWIFIVLWT